MNFRFPKPQFSLDARPKGELDSLKRGLRYGREEVLGVAVDSALFYKSAIDPAVRKEVT